jgi:integrase
VNVPELDTSVFVLPETTTKTSIERVIVLNAIAMRVIEARRGVHDSYVFTYRDKPMARLHNNGWKTAWKKAGLPVEPAGQARRAQSAS